MQVAVDVWAIDLANTPVPTSSGMALLSQDERARHARYLDADAARIFATTRIALRRLLGRWLGMAPDGLRIEADAGGKPVLRAVPRAFFNVSHCATVALIACCDAAPVGIDVEQLPALALDEALATRLCTPSELAWMRENPARAERALTALWTRKEAVAKALGLGLALDPGTLALGDPAGNEGVASVPGHGRVAWRDLPSGSGIAAAVAVDSSAATHVDVAWRTDLA